MYAKALNKVSSRITIVFAGEEANKGRLTGSRFVVKTIYHEPDQTAEDTKCLKPFMQVEERTRDTWPSAWALERRHLFSGDEAHQGLKTSNHFDIVPVLGNTRTFVIR